MEFTIAQNTNSICRFCLNKTEDISLHCIWENGKYTIVNEMIQNLGLNILVDNLPNKICDACNKQLEQFCTFKQKIEENYKFLETMYSQNIAMEDVFDLKDCKLHQYLCQSCGKLFENNYSFSKHSLECNEKSLFELCDVDKSITHTMASLNDDISRLIDHKKQLLDNNIWSKTNLIDSVEIGQLFLVLKPQPESNSLESECELCSHNITSETEKMLHFLQHVVKNTNDVIEHRLFCSVCGKIFNSVHELEKHTTEHHIDNYNSVDCSIKGQRHVLHDEEDSLDSKEGTNFVFTCPICLSKFNMKDNLMSHGLTHLAKRYNCLKCKDFYINETAYNNHLKQHPTYRYPCSKCNKVLASKSSLNKHIQIHNTSLNSHMCEICGKKFKGLNYLQIHRKKHGRKNRICSDCGYRTGSSSDLQVHLRIHTNERPYKCTFGNCNKSYKTCSQLSQHTKSHLNIRNHHCTICDKSFTTSGSLKNHHRLHSGERPYNCPICLIQFKRRHHVKVHLKSQHLLTV